MVTIRMVRMTLFAVATLGLSGAAAADEYKTKVVVKNLKRPTGIAVNLSRQVYFTELPTPGVGGGAGGKNTVNVLNPKNGKVRNLTTGEPEPTNLAVNLFGDVYWTCKSAGVVLSLERGRGDAGLVTGGLDNPSGMAAYPLGLAVFFTEVPTPGVSGANGGRNKVSKLKLSTGSITVIDEGDPDPIDVTVAPFGTTVYWTCRSAGVIVEAKRRW